MFALKRRYFFKKFKYWRDFYRPRDDILTSV